MTFGGTVGGLLWVVTYVSEDLVASIVREAKNYFSMSITTYETKQHHYADDPV
jgi:hypothetical protein